jgi:hypothetical protein
MRIRVYSKEDICNMNDNSNLDCCLNAVAKLCKLNDDEFRVVWKDNNNKVLTVIPNISEHPFNLNNFVKPAVLILGGYNSKFIAYINVPTLAEKHLLSQGILPPKYTIVNENTKVSQLPNITPEQAKYAILIGSNGYRETPYESNTSNKFVKTGMIVEVPFDPTNPYNNKIFRYRIKVQSTSFYKPKVNFKPSYPDSEMKYNKSYS